MSQFPENNADRETTSLLTFFANNSYHLRILVGLSLVNLPDNMQARTLFKTKKQLQDILRSEMTPAELYLYKMLNKLWVPEPVFKFGNKVFVNVKNIQMKRLVVK